MSEVQYLKKEKQGALTRLMPKLGLLFLLLNSMLGTTFLARAFVLLASTICIVICLICKSNFHPLRVRGRSYPYKPKGGGYSYKYPSTVFARKL